MKKMCIGIACSALFMAFSGGVNIARAMAVGPSPEPDSVAVPEFGVIPGIAAFLASGGTYFLLKKRRN